MKKIIRPWFSGLGDHLQHSTLPRYFSELGHEVYLSNQARARNNEIIDLVWMKNPYIKGISNTPPNAGDIPGYVYENKYGNFIMNVEAAHGLEPKNTLPEVYYIPQKYQELSKSILIDISCKSLEDKYDFDKIEKHLVQYEDELVYILKNKNIYPDSNNLPFMVMEVDSIYDYCDYIASCKKFVCLSSGGNSLSAALHLTNTDCLVQHTDTIDSMYERNLYFYPNINYIWL